MGRMYDHLSARRVLMAELSGERVGVDRGYIGWIVW